MITILRALWSCRRISANVMGGDAAGPKERLNGA